MSKDFKMHPAASALDEWYDKNKGGGDYSKRTAGMVELGQREAFDILVVEAFYAGYAAGEMCNGKKCMGKKTSMKLRAV